MSVKRDIGRACLIHVNYLDIYVISDIVYRLNKYWKQEKLLPYQGPCQLVFLWTFR
jgi:hypothetical protein